MSRASLSSPDIVSVTMRSIFRKSVLNSAVYHDDMSNSILYSEQEPVEDESDFHTLHGQPMPSSSCAYNKFDTMEENVSMSIPLANAVATAQTSSFNTRMILETLQKEFLESKRNSFHYQKVILELEDKQNRLERALFASQMESNIIRSELNEKEEKIDVLESATSSQLKEIASLEASNRDFKNKIAELEETVAELNHDIEAKLSQIEKQRKEIERISRKHRAIGEKEEEQAKISRKILDDGFDELTPNDPVAWPKKLILIINVKSKGIDIFLVKDVKEKLVSTWRTQWSPSLTELLKARRAPARSMRPCTLEEFILILDQLEKGGRARLVLSPDDHLDLDASDGSILMKPLLNDISTSVSDVLELENNIRSDVDKIIFVGNVGRLSYVREMINEEFIGLSRSREMSKEDELALKSAKVAKGSESVTTFDR